MRGVPDLVAEFTALLRSFADAGIEYAVCGGLAANIYGADRFTRDIDVLVAPDRLEAALSAARLCGFTIDAGIIPFGDRQMHRLVKLVAGWEEELPLDLLIADGGTYAAAFASRVRVEREGTDLWLVGRSELIAMKRESARPIDLQDIERLS